MLSHTDLVKLESAVHCLGELLAVPPSGNALTVIANLQDKARTAFAETKDPHRSCRDQILQLKEDRVALVTQLRNALDRNSEPVLPSSSIILSPVNAEANELLQRGVVAAMILDYAFSGIE